MLKSPPRQRERKILKEILKIRSASSPKSLKTCYDQSSFPLGITLSDSGKISIERKITRGFK